MSVNIMQHMAVAIFLLRVTIASSDSNKPRPILVNTKSETFIDATSQIVIINYKIRVQNKHETPVSSYLFHIDPLFIKNLSYIEAIDHNDHSLAINRVKSNENNELAFEIQFYNSLFPDGIESLKISVVIINYLRSLPKSVKQGENHFVLLPINIYYYSEYLTKDHTTFVYLGSSIATVNGANYNTSQDENYKGLQFGPYKDLEPYSVFESTFHYENKSPFLVVDKLDRFIHISHWGFLKVWDNITLRHAGPTFFGPFERETQIDYHHTDTRIDKFTSTLPGQAFDIYLKDEIGMLSSFKVEYDIDDKVQVHIKPRFVLFGGWKIQYEIGYTVQNSDFLIYNGNITYTLKFPVVDQIFKDMVITEANINIILPEGAILQSIEPNYNTYNKRIGEYCYFFDVICREMISFQRTNLVNRHSFTLMYIKYSYPFFILLIKPLYISLVIFVVFLYFIIYHNIFPGLPEQLTPRCNPTPYQPLLNVQKAVKRKKSKTSKNH